jgi:glycosyltransferase involved in cell wall biosynthesis
LLGNCRGQVIPNSFYGYEATVIEKRDKSSTIKVGLAAMNPKSWIKGGDIVTSLILKHSNGGFIQFFSLSDFAHYKDFWSTIDVLLVPSQADNSPNVIHEAKLWGIPVIASDVGGIPEILSEDFDSCISLESLTLNVIESEIRRAYEFSNDIIARRRESERHRKYIDSSLERHIEFYKLLPSK